MRRKIINAKEGEKLITAGAALSVSAMSSMIRTLSFVQRKFYFKPHKYFTATAIYHYGLSFYYLMG